MQAQIITEVDGEKYVYGTYPFNTNEQKNRVNEICRYIKNVGNIDAYVECVEE